MKLIKNMTFAALALLGAGSAYSTTTIYIAGSTGDRAGTQLGISELLTGWTFQGDKGATNSTTPSTLSKATGANYGVWTGTYSGQSVIIKTSFAGALAGVQAIAGNVPQYFVLSNGGGTTTLTDPTSANLGTAAVSATADFAFSTVFQATTPFVAGVYNGVTYSAVTEELIGVSPLGFYASPGFPTGSANITTALAKQLYTKGSLPLSLFTGNSGDNNKIVYALDRDTDAGQRWGIFNEIDLGTSGTVTAWQPTITGQTTTSGITYGGTVNSQALWPAETKSGIYSPTGGGGYNSGSSIAVPLTAVLGSDAYQGKYYNTDTSTYEYLYPNATAGYYIGYLTPSDANPDLLGTTGVVPSGSRGVSLSYNGVPLTTANVQSGLYTAWVYNRIIEPVGGVTTGTLQQSFHDALRDQIKNTAAAASGAIAIDSNFQVQRSTDGGDVTIIGQ